MNNNFMNKIAKYAERLVLKEKDKYLSGEKNEFFSFDLSREYLFKAIDEAGELLSANHALMKKITDLENQLDLTRAELYRITDNAMTLKVENQELKRKIKDLEDRLWGRSKL